MRKDVSPCELRIRTSIWGLTCKLMLRLGEKFSTGFPLQEKLGDPCVAHCGKEMKSRCKAS